MLAAVVRHDAKLARLSSDGERTEREHVAGAVRRGMLPASDLHGPPVPMCAAYLLEWHQELARTRSFVAAGMSVLPEPLTYPVIESWARLLDRHPSPGDVEALLYLDAVARNPEG